MCPARTSVAVRDRIDVHTLGVYTMKPSAMCQPVLNNIYCKCEWRENKTGLTSYRTRHWRPVVTAAGWWSWTREAGLRWHQNPRIEHRRPDWTCPPHTPYTVACQCPHIYPVRRWKLKKNMNRSNGGGSHGTYSNLVPPVPWAHRTCTLCVYPSVWTPSSDDRYHRTGCMWTWSPSVHNRRRRFSIIFIFKL
jgi:hypothetical protein